MSDVPVLNKPLPGPGVAGEDPAGLLPPPSPFPFEVPPPQPGDPVATEDYLRQLRERLNAYVKQQDAQFLTQVAASGQMQAFEQQGILRQQQEDLQHAMMAMQALGANATEAWRMPGTRQEFGNMMAGLRGKAAQFPEMQPQLDQLQQMVNTQGSIGERMQMDVAGLESYMRQVAESDAKNPTAGLLDTLLSEMSFGTVGSGSTPRERVSGQLREALDVYSREAVRPQSRISKQSPLKTRSFIK